MQATPGGFPIKVGNLPRCAGHSRQVSDFSRTPVEHRRFSHVSDFSRTPGVHRGHVCARDMIVHGLRATGCPERTGCEGAHVRRELARGEGAVGRRDRGQAGLSRDPAGCRGRGGRGGCAPRIFDDVELAGQLARGFRSRGYGQRRAAQALRHRRVSPADADAALADVFGDADEASLADAALGSRPVADAAEQQRAVAFLVRRGFSTGVAWQVVGARSRG